jgi:hypothetical protein
MNLALSPPLFILYFFMISYILDRTGPKKKSYYLKYEMLLLQFEDDGITWGDAVWMKGAVS